MEVDCDFLFDYATDRKIADLILDMVITFFKYTYSFQPPYCPGVYSSSNRNENNESSWGGTGA
jgi:hypothetical protein